MLDPYSDFPGNPLVNQIFEGIFVVSVVVFMVKRVFNSIINSIYHEDIVSGKFFIFASVMVLIFFFDKPKWHPLGIIAWWFSIVFFLYRGCYCGCNSTENISDGGKIFAAIAQDTKKSSLLPESSRLAASSNPKRLGSAFFSGETCGENRCNIPAEILDEWKCLKNLSPEAAEMALQNSPEGEEIRLRLEEYGCHLALDKAEFYILKNRLECLFPQLKNTPTQAYFDSSNVLNKNADFNGKQGVINTEEKITISCPSCNQKFRIPCGGWICANCPHCGLRIEVKGDFSRNGYECRSGIGSRRA